MNEIQHEYCNSVWWLNPPVSDNFLKVAYELHRYTKSPREAFKTAYSCLRASMNATV